MRPKDLVRVGGSAHLIEEKVLEELAYDDPTSVLMLVPGVYLRQEDGYGLRPNIGLRGANSERSKKVTLMEDGVLFGPAPYSAPAAYYFPLMARITGVEVFKGPSAIMYGPNTIGGAINLQSRPIPRELEGELDIAYGKDDYVKVHGHGGLSETWGGVLLEGAHLRSGGFKVLDGGGDTGFYKTELLAKGMLQSDPLQDVYHRVDVKLGYSREISYETYLGLSDDDFDAQPDRRYRATTLDRFELERFQLEASYLLQIGEGFDLSATFYRHDMSRAWRKISRFRDGPALADILAAPDSGVRSVFYRILTGEEDSSSEDEALMIGTNSRAFISQGLSAALRWQLETGPIAHDLQAGLRIHHDEIQRHHFEDAFLMQSGRLQPEGTGTDTTTRSVGSTVAFAAHLLYGLHGWNFTLTPGFRFESIHTVMRDHLGDSREAGQQNVPLFGVGLHYGITNEIGVLAGVHMGFSPVSPGQADEIDPETSVNLEFGFRWSAPDSGLLVEAIGFYNDYTNLIGECSFSAGCGEADLDRQFNAGAVDIGGFELVGAYRFELPWDLALPVRATYTFTHTQTRTSFTSDNPQLGDVKKGDHLPYVPMHQASLMIGMDAPDWGFDIATTFVDEMREQASQGDTSDADMTDRAVYVDISGHYAPLDWLTLYLKMENLLQQRPIVSRRPYGARPGKPFTALGGIRLTI